jgi:pantoate--beta-alanine ligase
MMQIFRRLDEPRAFARATKAGGESVGLVPTMGFLHEGHLSLIRAARQHAERVVVTLFVNPTQFGPKEDLDKYPRDFDRDCALCESAGADALFAPEAAHIYPTGHATKVEVEGSLTSGLCAASRPGHFSGVATVVTKLFNLCEPDVAVFGQKDAQQAAVIRRFTADLNLPVKIVVAPIIRESDGLAMSSRNAYLSREERAQATVLKRSLDAAVTLYDGGERRTEVILTAVLDALESAPLARVDYAELVDASTFEPITMLERRALLALAVFFGPTRLIDNTLLPNTGVI